MWSLVMDELLRDLNWTGYYAAGYADNTVILINRKFPLTAFEVLQTALGLIQQWCHRTDLSINPGTMVVIPFTKKKTLKGLKAPTLFVKTTQVSTKVNYLD
jgi:hypothetical protein